MKPEDAFTKKSLKRYKAVKKALKRMPVLDGFVIIPGRERVPGKRSGRVYVKVWHPLGGTEVFYFNFTPKTYDVLFVVGLMVDNMCRRVLNDSRNS
jgi:hypothetical protein